MRIRYLGLLTACAFGLLGLATTSCDHMASDGNATKFYMPYAGTQTNWPTANGSFVTQYDGMTIYHGLPPKPYIILGRFDRSDIPNFRLVKCARTQQATAIFIAEHNVTEAQYDSGVTLYGRNVSYTTPGHVHTVEKLQGIPYLIQIIGDPIPPKAPTHTSAAITGRR